jgi:hypothetical protein
MSINSPRAGDDKSSSYFALASLVLRYAQLSNGDIFSDAKLA